MTEVIPFRGIHYNASREDAENLVAPPYDVISPELREELYKKSAHNIVRIDFGIENPGDSDTDNKYTRARSYMESWLAAGTLVREDKPIYYAYRITYDYRGKRMGLTGIFGLVELVELGNGVYPHEATHSKPKQDRLSLMSEAQANTSPIYSLYRAKGDVVPSILKKTTVAAPYLKSTDADGTLHEFWMIDSAQDVDAIRSALKGAPIFIADGHHRYETALEYQRIMREKDGKPADKKPYDYVLMFLADVNDPGLTVLPTHRMITVDVPTLVERMSDTFKVEQLADGADILAAIGGRAHCFGMYADGKRYVLYCKGCTIEGVAPELETLDVVVLHKMVFGRLLEVGNWGYEMDYNKTLGMVDHGEYDAAFFLNPTRVTDVEAVAAKMLRMPPKSTYFYPKVKTGFVINTLKTF